MNSVITYFTRKTCTKDYFTEKKNLTKTCYEYIMKHNMIKGVDYKWIGMNGNLGMFAYPHEKVAVILHKKPAP